MKILQDLLSTLPDGTVQQVCIGIHWTGVVVEVAGRLRCGLASSQLSGHKHTGIPGVPQAGELAGLPGKQLAQFCLDVSMPTLVSVGMAALNGLLLFEELETQAVNAEEIIASLGQQRKTVMVGHFPFVNNLRRSLRDLAVLEMDPGPGDLPATEAVIVLPSAELVAITGMTFLNHTLEDVLGLCNPQALIMLIGASTPLSMRLFNYGIDILSGAVVENIEAVMRCLAQGGNYRQIHQAGIRLATMTRPGIYLSSSSYQG